MSVLLPYSYSRGRLSGVGLGNFLHVIKSLFKVSSSVRVQEKKNAEVPIAAHILKQYHKVTFRFFHFRGLLSLLYFSGTEIYFHQNKWTGQFILAKLTSF